MGDLDGRGLNDLPPRLMVLMYVAYRVDWSVVTEKAGRDIREDVYSPRSYGHRGDPRGDSGRLSSICRIKLPGW